MDLLDGLRVFCAVAGERSFTRGAERCGVPQPVASRRVAALEDHLGASLLVRTSRRVELSAAGERLLPLAEELVARGDQVRRLFLADRPGLVIAVPPGLDPRSRAAVRRGLPDLGVEFVDDRPARRAERLSAGEVDLAVLAVPRDEADVVVPLGLAHADDLGGRRLLLGGLRRPVRERDLPARAVHLAHEDDVPTVRDPVRTACHAAGLRADQVVVALSPSERWTRVHERGDVVLCAAAEATAQGLRWSRLSRPDVLRAYRVSGDLDLGTTERRALLQRLATGLDGAVVDRTPGGEDGAR